MPNTGNTEFLNSYLSDCPPEKMPAKDTSKIVIAEGEDGSKESVMISEEEWAKNLEKAMKEHERSRRDQLGPGC
jgi:hypothetical protein